MSTDKVFYFFHVLVRFWMIVFIKVLELFIMFILYSNF